MKHGRTCRKAKHIGAGHMHPKEYDGIYEVDGVRYCGRCHQFIEQGDEIEEEYIHMTTHDDGGPVVVPTMTLRDWFAGQALAGMLAKYGADCAHGNMAKHSFNYADAMIAEKRRREGGGK